MSRKDDRQPPPALRETTRAALNKLLETHDILVAVIIRGPDAGLHVQVLAEPSQEVLEVLERTTAAYRRYLRGEAPDEQPRH